MDELEAAFLDYRNALPGGTVEREEMPLSDAEKAWLIDSNWLAQYEQGDSGIDEISAHLDSYRSGSQKRVAISTKGELEPNWRSLAFTEIAAIEAARDPAVLAFRTDVLGGHTIKLEAVKSWVETSAMQDGPTTHLVTIPYDSKQVPRSPQEAEELGIKASWPPPVILKFPDPGGKRVDAARIRLGGVLDRLRRLAMHLELSYGWGMPYAVAFILTDESPPSLRGSVTATRHEPPRPSTATITVNPDYVSPSDVARLYRDTMRDEEFSLHGGEPGAGRPLQEKSARLAVFAARHDGAGSWAELMTRWNTKDAKWKYADRRQFARECRRAYERVMGHSLEVRNAQSQG